MKKAISTDKAPAAIGPYSQAIEVGEMIYTSGVIPVNPESGEIPQGVQEQARQVFKNMTALLNAAGRIPVCSVGGLPPGAPVFLVFVQ